MRADGAPVARTVWSCATPVSAGLERSLITALTSADLQRKDDLLPVPSPCPHSLLHPAFTAVCPGCLMAGRPAGRRAGAIDTGGGHDGRSNSHEPRFT